MPVLVGNPRCPVNMNTHTVSTRVTGRLPFVALLSAWAALLAIPTAQASTIVDQVDIIDGRVDVNEDGVIRGFDNATNVLLFFNNNAPIQVDIIDGLVDVTENGSVTTYDDLSSFNLASVPPTTDRMGIVDGFVDVNQSGTITNYDDATNIRLVRLVGSVVDQVDIVDGQVDVNEDGAIDDEDVTPYFLLGFDDGALLPAYISGGFFSDYGFVSVFLQLPGGYIFGGATLINADLNDLVNDRPSSNQVDMIYGAVDVTEGGVVNTGDDATDVKLVTLGDPVVDNVNIRDGHVDVNEDGVIGTLDDLKNVLLLFDDAAPIRVDIIDGLVDVTENGSVTTYDDLPNTDVAYFDYADLDLRVFGREVDIIDGMVDVVRDGSIDVLDDLNTVQLLVP
jgi:hypothetical protein